MAITTIIIPYSGNIYTLYAYIWIYGLGCGAWNMSNNVWLIEVWKQNSAPFLQLSQFMFGIGTIIGPMVEKSYLTGEYVIDDNISISNITHLIDSVDRRTKLKIPFLFCGAIQIIGIVIHIFKTLI